MGRGNAGRLQYRSPEKPVPFLSAPCCRRLYLRAAIAGENTNRRLRRGVSRCLRALINIVFFLGGGREGVLRPSSCLSQFSRRWRGNFFFGIFPPSSFLAVPCASATLIIFPSPPPPPVRNSPRVHTASQATNRARSTQGKQKKQKKHCLRD